MEDKTKRPKKKVDLVKKHPSYSSNFSYEIGKYREEKNILGIKKQLSDAAPGDLALLNSFKQKESHVKHLGNELETKLKQNGCIDSEGNYYSTIQERNNRINLKGIEAIMKELEIDYTEGTFSGSAEPEMFETAFRRILRKIKELKKD